MRSLDLLLASSYLLVLAGLSTAARRSVLLTTAGSSSSGVTFFECAGLAADRRSCIFSNIYYDISIDTFFVAGVNVADMEVVAEEVNSSPSYNVGVLHGDVPRPEDVVFRSGFNVLWGFNAGVAYSFGHALVHGLYPIYATLYTLLGGDVPLEFNIMNRSGDTPPVFDHICLASQNRVYNWQQLRQNITTSGKKWILFEHAVLGDRGMNEFALSLNAADKPPPNVYNNAGWYHFRAWMYKAAGLDPNYQPDTQHIVLIDKSHLVNGEKDRRRIWNIDDVEASLKLKFPDVQVSKVNFMQRPWRKQLEILSQTTVFVTTEGSASFRYVFLPKGANVILLGHPDNMTVGAKPIAAHKPYHEVEKYFPINYIRFIKYRVDFNNQDEYKFWERPQNYLPWQTYDAHIVVKVDRLEPLVSAAVRYYSAHKEWHIPGLQSA